MRPLLVTDDSLDSLRVPLDARYHGDGDQRRPTATDDNDASDRTGKWERGTEIDLGTLARYTVHVTGLPEAGVCGCPKDLLLETRTTVDGTPTASRDSPRHGKRARRRFGAFSFFSPFLFYSFSNSLARSDVQTCGCDREIFLCSEHGTVCTSGNSTREEMT